MALIMTTSSCSIFVNPSQTMWGFFLACGPCPVVLLVWTFQNGKQKEEKGQYYYSILPYSWLPVPPPNTAKRRPNFPLKRDCISISCPSSLLISTGHQKVSMCLMCDISDGIICAQISSFSEVSSQWAPTYSCLM